MKRNFYTFLTLMMTLFIGTQTFAQGTLTGRVLDQETKDGLSGATIFLDGTTKGTFADFDGNFSLTAPAGSYTVKVSMMGYQTLEKEITLTDGSVNEMGSFTLGSDAIAIGNVEILASVAIDRKTPVAVSTVGTREIEEKLSNQEFPELLRSTPSVYVTRSGGGFGDARINVRGFDQRNTAVLINGIPVNDMENGWVYWSNWAGLADVTRTMQIQRGLGASKLAINSVGGTINIITKTTDMEAGGSVGYAMGNDGFMRINATASTGRLEGGWAVTLSGSRTMGNGYIDATYIDAWSYFGSVAKDFGAKHQLVFTAIGAPQRHGQRTFRERLSNYVPVDSTQDYEEMVKGSTTSNFDERIDGDGFKYSSIGNVRYNSDWGLVGNGQVYNIRENFYHKPQFALNHYWTVNDNININTSAYYSIGRGGGTGDRGSIGGLGTWGYRNENGIIRMSDIIRWNTGTSGITDMPASGHHQDATYGYVATENTGLIKRASMNEHNWLGLLSTANIKLNEKMDLITGIDVRQYRGLHYRRVDDLMGNDFWLESRNINLQVDSVDANGDGTIDNRETGALVDREGPGTEQEDKVNYDNDGIVGWQGAFAQLEVSPSEDFNFFVAASGSNTSYKREDRFAYAGDEQITDALNFLGFNTKAGANYNINDNHNVFLNTGYYSRAPIFDVAFPGFSNDGNPDALNEKVFAVELGYGLRTKFLNANVNLYRTNWIDKNLIRRLQDANGNDFTANVTGLNAIHQGVEVDLSYSPVEGLVIMGMASIGDWQWTNNVDAVISDQNDVPVDTLTVFADGLKVGDAAQSTFALDVSYKFPFGLKVWARDNFYSNLYANFDPTSRSVEADAGVQAWRLPDYNLLDAGLSYRYEFSRYAVTVNGNVNNLLDELYVAEANDDPSAATLDRLRGFYGFGRTWSAGVKFDF